jgi:hypothetical protein
LPWSNRRRKGWSKRRWCCSLVVPTNGRPLSTLSAGRVVEGTPGLATRPLFRESARGAALTECRVRSTLLAFPFERDPLPQDRRLPPVPGGRWHG